MNNKLLTTNAIDNKGFRGFASSTPVSKFHNERYKHSSTIPYRP